MVETAAALGTWAAVVAIFYIEVLRPRIRRPRLELRRPASRAALTAMTSWIDGPHEAWHRLEVVNTGQTSARDVEAVITAGRLDHTEALDAAEHEGFSSLLTGRSLKWANVDTSRVALPPQSSRLIDVIHQYSIHNRPSQYPSGLAISIYPASRIARDRVPAGRFALEVALSAENVPSRSFLVECDVDPSWDGEGSPRVVLDVSQPRRESFVVRCLATRSYNTTFTAAARLRLRALGITTRRSAAKYKSRGSDPSSGPKM